MDFFKEASYRLWHLLFNATRRGKPARYSDKGSGPDLQISRRGLWPGATCLPPRYQVAGISVFQVKHNRFFIKNLNKTKQKNCPHLLNCLHNLQILLSFSLFFFKLRSFWNALCTNLVENWDR